MFVLNDDLSIYCTRGDCGEISINAHINGEPSVFSAGDVLRLKVFEKKGCDTVVMQRDFTVEEDADSFVISLTAADTKIGKVISKPVDYWYEIELNPETHPQTIIGYDEDGPKVFKLFPEGKDVDAEEIEKVGSKTLQELVDYALEQAKESGAFNGADGKDGKDGYTPQKGIDYFDGKDGQNGQNGKDGKDGKDGYTPQKGVDYFDGMDGKDGINGIPCTHSWDGTILTMTSASGTTSVDLQGENGKTPVRGTDYWTEADKSEIVSDVLASLPNGDEVAY
ncbi:MAG: hypothetical protein IJY94_05515 [Clostridia bacterium]|nr:hypothetical protein [Clostridia bacterium]